MLTQLIILGSIPQVITTIDYEKSNYAKYEPASSEASEVANEGI